MPMIDVYAPVGTFRDRARLVRDLATAVMTIERVPNIPLFPSEHRGVRARAAAR